ncbi:MULTISPECIES: lipocalin family protein [unclassified Thiocapsa]
MNPRPWLLVLFLLLPMLLAAGCTGVPEGIAPVRGFDAERYLGTWHEIARLDHRFERGLEQVTATYSRREDGGLAVLNRGYDPAAGVWKSAEGRAYFQSTPDVASLKVSFFGPFYGGYHVFELDPEYRWAMISGPTREYLWILARQPQLPAEILEDLIAKARAAGFETGALIFPLPSVAPVVTSAVPDEDR